MADVTQVLLADDLSGPHKAEQLIPLVYDELRKLAAHRLAQEKPGQTMQTTSLVHEAFVRLVDQDQVQLWENRRHFFAAAAEAMRRILIERARQRNTEKHGGLVHRQELDEFDLASEERSAELLALDEALREFETHDPQAAELVKLRYFGGLSHQDAAAALGLSRRAADRLWALARAWLYAQLRD